MTDITSMSEVSSFFATGESGEESRTGVYTYLTTDIRTNRVIGEIELQNVSYSRKLSGPGDASAEFPVPNARIANDLRLTTTPGRTGLYIMRDGSPMWGGIIWKRAYDRSSRRVQLGCAGFESYFYHRFQNLTLVFADADQLDIARAIVGPYIPDMLQMTVSSAMSGVKRDRVMFDYEFKTRGEELEALGSLEKGFDWNVNVYLDPDGTLQRRLDFGYPFAGLGASNTSHVFEYPGNISQFTLSEDAESGGNYVVAIGGGEGEDQLWAYALDYTSINNGYPVLETSRSYKSVVSPSTLQAHANEDYSRLRVPISVYTISVRPSDDPALGTYAPGDFARFIIDDPWLGERADFMSRITGYSVQVSDSGGPESVDVSFEAPERTQDEASVS